MNNYIGLHSRLRYLLIRRKCNISEFKLFTMKSTIGEDSKGTSAESIRKEIKRKPKKSFISNIFSEYCANTSIHGIGYLGADDRSIIEKIWWMVVFALSVAACGVLITNTWKKWQNTPVVMSFSHAQTPIWEIPFPAVTICPVNKVRQTVYNYTHMYRQRDNLTANEHKKLWDISLSCTSQFIYNLDAVNETTDKEAITSILEVAPSMYTIFYIIWQGNFESTYSIKKYFAPQLTEDGLCFTFNSLIGKDMYTDQVNPNMILEGHTKVNQGWTLENGYPDDENMQTYPERAALDGISSGISIVLMSTSHDKDYVCGDFTSGYKVLLHNPAETPRVMQQYILAPLNRQVTVSVKPEMVTTSKGLKHVSPHIRNCYFDGEKTLRFYKIYTQDNCQIECFANITQQVCKCLPFFSPRDNGTDICGFGAMNCLDKVQGYVLLFEKSKKKVNYNPTDSLAYKIFDKCDCLPACTSVQYTAETSQTNFHYAKTMEQSGVEQHAIEYTETTRVVIFFKNTQFMTLHRSEMFGLTEFMASCGGLLGLFMGFSFLSLAEIVYFMTLRVWCRMRNTENIYDAST